MTDEKPKLWKVSEHPGQWIGIEEVDSVPTHLVLGLHDIGMKDVYQHIVELHNAAEIQRVTGWCLIRLNTRKPKWIVQSIHESEPDLAEWSQDHPQETPVKAILNAWDWWQKQQSTPSR